MSTDTLTIPVGPAVFGRVIDPSGEPLDGRGAPDGAPRRPLVQTAATPRATLPLLETGIKVVDLLAPIPRGGCVGIYGPPAVGKLVLIIELVRRVSDRGGSAIFVGTEAHSYEATDLMRTMTAEGLAARTAMVFTRIDDPPAAAAQAARAGLTIARDVAGGQHDVLLLVDRELVDEATAAELSAALGPHVTLIFHGPPTDSPGPVDALIRCAPEVAQRQLWPAVDRLGSWSRLLEGDSEPAQVAAAARALFRQPGGADQRVERLEQYLTQPFFCAETYTDIPGEHVPRAVTLRDVAAICAGAWDHVEPRALRFQGGLA